MVTTAERMAASGRDVDHLRCRNNPALVTRSVSAWANSVGSLMFVESKAGRISSGERLTEAARLTTKAPRARSSCTTDAPSLSIPTATAGKRGFSNLSRGLGIGDLWIGDYSREIPEPHYHSVYGVPDVDTSLEEL